ncbi:MAG TPA: DUF4954 family protein [Ignavibacteriaceae bacterium]|nr:DUF4954 family protein [Ignavibacteriaceae bacterium]
METVSILPAGSIGKNFIPEEFLPKGKDEYYYRNLQTMWPADRWRHLTSAEIKKLEKNNNFSNDWNDVLVTEKFESKLIVNSSFYGLVRIGHVRNVIIEHHDLRLPAGIRNSLIISCDIGDDTAIHNAGYLSHIIIGSRCIISKVDEINTSDHAKFGNGIIKEGEDEEVRIWIDLMNEAGCRQVLPFEGMIAADAYMWAKYRDDKPLQEKLKEITQNSFDSHRGFYGLIGTQCVIKNSRILKDVKIGPHCYIKGANKLKNLTINSSEEEPTQIGEGVELVNGIIGYGCHVFYGVKAVRFILGTNSNLKYGARLINSFLADNSTISCCEVLNNLIFPAHEQHHNNSFLVASIVMGQSNIAAGATIGSNHNSRANDNEVQAGRGFWPGLCTSIKHPSRFASFILLSKGDYPAELDIPLPFSLLNNNESQDCLEVMPAFWWMYNMYALARNSGKFKSRDNRMHKIQNIEYETLAPDTVEEIVNACRLLEIWTAKAWLLAGNDTEVKNENKLIELGKELLSGPADKIKKLEILGEDMEKSGRKAVILKVHSAYHAYQDMLHYYAVKNILNYLKSNPGAVFSSMEKELNEERIINWVNFGGQLIPGKDADQLRADIASGKLGSWDEIHKRYDRLWEKYPLEKQKHAYAILCGLNCSAGLTKDQWISALDKGAKIQEFISEQVYISRKKDYDNKFRKATFRNIDEMTAAIGKIDDNSFVKQVRQETREFKELISEIKKMN